MAAAAADPAMPSASASTGSKNENREDRQKSKQAENQKLKQDDPEYKHLEEKAKELDTRGDWYMKAKKGIDQHTTATMRDTAKSGRAAWPAAQNVGTDWHPAAPLAPKHGFYDERYRCRTLPTEDLVDDDLVRALFLGSEEEEGAERISLAFKGVGDDNCDIIAECLADEKCRCKQLWLNDNQIGFEGIAELWKGLRDNPNKSKQPLEELYLTYNSFGDAGLKLLLKALETNRKLLKLELGACQIGKEETSNKTNMAADMIKKAIASNQTVEHIGLFGNDANMDDDLPAIYKTLDNRRAQREKREVDTRK